LRLSLCFSLKQLYKGREFLGSGVGDGKISDTPFDSMSGRRIRVLHSFASCLMLKLSKLSEAVASWEHCGAEGLRSWQFAVALPASLSLI